MEIGISLPTASRKAFSPGLATLARRAEDDGAASLWVNDHLAMVADSQSTYPYSSDGRITWDVSEPQLEALVSLAHVAAVTTTARLGTAVLVLPQRHPIEVAKTAATIDVLSGGRLSLGVGAGWFAEEMHVLGYSFQDRGTRLEECIRLLRACWSGKVDAFDGRHFTIPPGVVMEPRPLQDFGPPILVGGVSVAARRRAARVGDGWLAVSDADGFSVNAFRSRLAEITELREAHSRSGPFIGIVKINCSSASDDEVVSAVVAARQAGFDEAVLDLPWSVPDHALQCLRLAVKAVS
ncbi:TIGR03619 family F420-dependent LLM class oxidoreductase [Streptomyces violaceus]|uniref:TIGR03619 family F420-dependent LLM class oxidoreductase n=1 Tax=Streptomyces violaceus TaxID=1936 RepID=UPI002E2CA0A2|nr:TIGR03619 family F420-dependent LLM class oxidoreductase [Streptomyces violaceus]